VIPVEQQVFEMYPGAGFGVLCVHGFHGHRTAAFTAVKEQELASIRRRLEGYDRKALTATEPVCHYVSYYKRFKKTYHVLHQLESILAGKSIPDGFPLVESMFLAEVKHALLMAGLSLDEMDPPFTIGVAQGDEHYIGAAGEDVHVKASDIFLRDRMGIVLSTIYGQDSRTRITEKTENAMFLVDGVDGIAKDMIFSALEDILKYLRLFVPAVEVTCMDVLCSRNDA